MTILSSIGITIQLYAANEDCSEQSICVDLIKNGAGDPKQHFLSSIFILQ